MSHTHLSQSKSRRDLAGSLRGSRPRKHARLRHRRLQAERLEDRRLLAADFELSCLLPANGGDGSSGFVVNGITDQGQLGRSANASPQPLGDVNQDGIDDFYLPAWEVQEQLPSPCPGVHNLRPSGSGGGFLLNWI